MEYKDYYETLGVSRSATQDEIKKAYRRLARKYHPDVSTESDAEAQFKALGEAYEVLKDPEKRAAYDQLGANWQAGQEFTPPPGWESSFNFGGGRGSSQGPFGFSDFFESLFGAQGFSSQGFSSQGFSSQGFGSGGAAGFHPGGGQARGRDQEVRVAISLRDAFNGAQKTLSLSSANGAGGKTKTLNVKIPAGVTQSQQIRLSGQGQPGPNGHNGDLYLHLEIEPDSRFKLDGNDVVLSLPITPWEAALGATIKVPTLSGAVDLKIPAGSQSGRKLRLKGRGLGKKPAGDQFVVLQIVVPPAESEEAKAFYKKMAASMPLDPRASW